MDQTGKLPAERANTTCHVLGKACTLWGVHSVVIFCRAFLTCSTSHLADTEATVAPNIWRQNLQCLHVEGDKNEGFGRNKTGAKGNRQFSQTVLPAAAAVADGAGKSSFVL